MLVGSGSAGIDLCRILVGISYDGNASAIPLLGSSVLRAFVLVIGLLLGFDICVHLHACHLNTCMLGPSWELCFLC